MRFNTDLFCVDSRPQFGFNIQHHTTHWELWFSEKNFDVCNPNVKTHSFTIKPTKKQVRKLRRQFRKENPPLTAHEEIVISVLGM